MLTQTEAFLLVQFHIIIIVVVISVHYIGRIFVYTHHLRFVTVFVPESVNLFRHITVSYLANSIVERLKRYAIIDPIPRGTSYEYGVFVCVCTKKVRNWL